MALLGKVTERGLRGSKLITFSSFTGLTTLVRLFAARRITMKITHVYPQVDTPPWCKDQTPIGNGDSEVDVWEEIRGTTMQDGVVLFIETHQYAWEEFLEMLEKDPFDRELVKSLSLDPLKKIVHIPAHGPMGSKLVVGKVGERKIVATHWEPETPATTKEIVVERYLNLSTAKYTHFVAKKAKECEARVVVIWEPSIEAGDLDYLHELKNVDVVIFHQVSEKVGVVVEGDVDPENWEDEFPVMGECELAAPEVIVNDLLIKGGIHVWAGMFESYKTVTGIELSAAILEKRKVFDHFDVLAQYPILFLCPDMSPELFQEYARPFGLMNQKDFRWLKPGGNTLQTVDSPVMERAVKDRILILDTMLDYANIREAFQSAEWINFFAKLRRLINVCGCAAIVMLVHPTKTGAKSNSIDPSEYLKDSVTFGGKIDVGFAFSKLENTSQIFIQRIKGRGFKKQLSFTIAHTDDDGNSTLDRGRFPVYLKPGEAGKKEDHTPQPGRKPNPKRDEQTQQILQLRNEGKTFSEIASTVGIPESTARAYYHANEWDKNKGEK